MNALKSAFGLSKNTPPQLQSLFQDVKSWDEARARLLETHLKVVQLVMQALDNKVVQVQKYIEGLDKLMSARIEQITSYCKNGVNDSEFFLVPTSLNSLKPCHQLLKHLLMEESQRELNLSKKGSILTTILERLKKLKETQCSQKNQSNERQGDTIRQLKSNIRFLIDCELPDQIEEVLGACKAVKTTFEEGKDFYLAVNRFVRFADKQLQKHQEIGRELLNLVSTFLKRQKQLRHTLRQILLEWVKEDFEDKIFHQQLSKKCSDELINDYYDIENLIPQEKMLWGGQSLLDYLQNFQILPFRQHQRLLIYNRQALYNAKIQAKVILTQQKYAYLFRINAEEPDFSFTLSKNIKITKKSPLILQVSQVRRTLLMREEIDFQFTLQFNLQSDQREFEEKSVNQGCVLDQK